jgi:hypothetical protein
LCFSCISNRRAQRVGWKQSCLPGPGAE